MLSTTHRRLWHLQQARKAAQAAPGAISGNKHRPACAISPTTRAGRISLPSSFDLSPDSLLGKNNALLNACLLSSEFGSPSAIEIAINTLLGRQAPASMNYQQLSSSEKEKLLSLAQDIVHELGDAETTESSDNPKSGRSKQRKSKNPVREAALGSLQADGRLRALPLYPKA